MADSLDFSRYSFPSSGDPEEDARTAASIRQHKAREAEGMCPNGCAPIIVVDDYTVRCDVCGFTGHGEAYMQSARAAGALQATERSDETNGPSHG